MNAREDMTTFVPSTEDVGMTAISMTGGIMGIGFMLLRRSPMSRLHSQVSVSFYHFIAKRNCFAPAAQSSIRVDLGGRRK